MTAIFAIPRLRVTDANGKPYPGAKVHFYETGTTTAKLVYQDADQLVPHAQPVVADSGGLLPLIYLSGAYKILITTTGDATIYEADELDAPLGTSGGALPIASGGTGATSAATALAALGAAAQTALDALASTVAGILTTIGGYPSFGTLAAKSKVLVSDLETTEFGPVLTQRAIVSTASRSALSGSIPIDNTTPLRSEGDTIFSTTFTPKSATSTIKIKVELWLAGNGGVRNGVVAFFTGIGASDPALAAGGVLISSTAIPCLSELTYEFVSGGTSAITLQVNAGASGAYVLNGLSAAGVFNGTMVSRLIIEEYSQP